MKSIAIFKSCAIIKKGRKEKAGAQQQIFVLKFDGALVYFYAGCIVSPLGNNNIGGLP